MPKVVLTNFILQVVLGEAHKRNVMMCYCPKIEGKGMGIQESNQ